VKTVSECESSGAIETARPYERPSSRASFDEPSSRNDSVRTMSSGRPGQAARREAAAMRSEMAWSKYSSSSSSCGRSTSAAASRNASSDSAGILPTSYSVTYFLISYYLLGN